jgi:hypothetical protein
MLNVCLKIVGLKGHQIISLPGAPTCLVPVVIRSQETGNKYRRKLKTATVNFLEISTL